MISRFFNKSFVVKFMIGIIVAIIFSIMLKATMITGLILTILTGTFLGVVNIMIYECAFIPNMKLLDKKSRIIQCICWIALIGISILILICIGVSVMIIISNFI